MAEGEPYAVRMNQIKKSFANVTVLDDVSFELRKGEVHALAGGNGAGKSTLMKILQGVYSLDSGKIEINGRKFDSLNIESAKEAGIGMVFQEFSLVPTMSVAQNIFMGAEQTIGRKFLNDAKMRKESQNILNRLGVHVNPDEEVANLATGYWQLTEIAKALRANASVLIFDEPTASLSAAETETFFKLIETLKEQSISIIYISHRMDEIRRIADRISILRNGRNLLTAKLPDISDEEIVEGIVGHQAKMLVKKKEKPSATSDVLLKLDRIRTDSGVDEASFEVRRGEVVGLAGLMGSGRTEITRALFGIDRITGGEMIFKGEKYDPKKPRDAMNVGIALVPEDRRKQGLVLTHSVRENLSMTRYRECEKLGLLSKRKIRELAAALIKRFKIKVSPASSPVLSLSGGNQQKIVIAKWLGRNPDLLIMDEPTAGVDIGTKAEVLSEISEFAKQGKGVLFVSSELNEMIAVCDRYVVLKHGKVVSELDADQVETETELQLAIQRAKIGSLQNRKSVA